MTTAQVMVAQLAVTVVIAGLTIYIVRQEIKR
jgi:hypothetical protein